MNVFEIGKDSRSWEFKALLALQLRGSCLSYAGCCDMNASMRIKEFCE